MSEEVIESETQTATASVKHLIGSGDYFADFDFSTLDTSLEGLLKAGVHFGHIKSRRHPKMDEYIYTTRKNVNIFDLSKTSQKLDEASAFLASVIKVGKPVLFVGMKKQTQDTVRSLANRLGESYVIDRWLGGTLTNFSCIRSRARYLNETNEKMKQGEFKKYTKFEQAKKKEEIDRLEKKVGGIKHMEQLPGAIVIADVKEASLVIHEAQKMNIPIIGITDTNTDPRFVDYPIPGNDDALSALRLLLGALGKTILATQVNKKNVAEAVKETVK
ncbi:MAG: 30S ribosomal protein S2 [Minisyncoccota bacterium]